MLLLLNHGKAERCEPPGCSRMYIRANIDQQGHHLRSIHRDRMHVKKPRAHAALWAATVQEPEMSRTIAARKSLVVSGAAERGIMVCGIGVGACIAANKIPGIRAALCHDTYSAHQCVEHDDVNVLCVGAWIIGIRVVEEVLRAFSDAQFSTEEEFRRRVQKLTA